MNSTLKNGITILVLGIIFFILVFFIFPIILVGTIFSGNTEAFMISGVLTFIFSIIGVIFIIAGPILIILGFIKEPRNINFTQNQQSMNSDRRCPKCGRIIPFDSVICPFCKHDFQEKNISEKKEGFCPKCGVKLDGTPYFCFKCGYQLR